MTNWHTPTWLSSVLPTAMLVVSMTLGAICAHHATGAAVAVGLACIPIVLVLGSALRLHRLALAVLFLSLVSDNVAERPGMGLVETPLYFPGLFLFTAMSTSIGIPGLKLFGIELLFLALLLHSLFFGAGRFTQTRKGTAGFTNAAKAACTAIAIWMAYGLLQGGVLSFAILQVRALFMSFALPLLWYRCFSQSCGAVPVLFTIVIAANIRALFCLLTRSQLLSSPGLAGDNLGSGFYVMTHSDSVLWVSAVSILALATIHTRSRLHAAGYISSIILLVAAIIANNRRIAFVGLAASAAAVYATGPVYIRSLTHKALQWALPLLLLYLLAGWNSLAPWAQPARVIQSVIEQQDSSSLTRDVENYNLTVTMKRHPIFGSGFGHEYIEQVKMHDISGIFSGYRYVPHNSILGLFGFCGPLGFALLWSPFAVAVLLACRATQGQLNTEGLVACLAAVAAITSHGVQAFGDMGAHSWLGALTISPLIGLVLIQHEIVETGQNVVAQRRDC